MTHRLSSLSWIVGVTATLTGACTAVHNIGDNPYGTGGVSDAATGGSSAAVGGSSAIGGTTSAPTGGTANVLSGGTSPITGTGGSSVLSGAEKILAYCHISTTGPGSEQVVAVPNDLTGPNWSVKAANCTLGGWNLQGCAGQNATFTSFPTGKTTAAGPVSIWVVQAGEATCCAYESDESNPGIYPAPCVTCPDTLAAANQYARCPATLCEAQRVAQSCGSEIPAGGSIVSPIWRETTECGDCSGTNNDWSKCYGVVKFDWGTHASYCYYGGQGPNGGSERGTNLVGTKYVDDVEHFCNMMSRSISGGDVPVCDLSGTTKIDCTSGSNSTTDAGTIVSCGTGGAPGAGGTSP